MDRNYPAMFGVARNHLKDLRKACEAAMTHMERVGDDSPCYYQMKTVCEWYDEIDTDEKLMAYVQYLATKEVPV